MKFLTGGRAFFEKMPGFIESDCDYVVLDENAEHDFKHIHNSTGDEYIYRKKPKNEMMALALKQREESLINFLLPEYAQALSLTIDDLKSLKVMTTRMPKRRYKYVKVIYDAYIENNAFELTHEQLYRAYFVYRKYRYPVYQIPYVDHCSSHDVLLMDSGLASAPSEDWATFTPKEGDAATVGCYDYEFDGEKWVKMCPEDR